MPNAVLSTILRFATIALLAIGNPAGAEHPCTASLVAMPDPFLCDAQPSRIQRFGPPIAYQTARNFFPSSWNQLSHDQRHNPVFAVSGNAPAWLRQGTFWAAGLTRLDYLGLTRALPSMGDPEEFGSTASQYLGNVMGVSVARGIVFVQLGRNEVWALDAATGTPIWRNEVLTAAGMGQTVVQEINGRLMAFAPVGDAAYTVKNTIDFSRARPHFRGGHFSGLYAFDALTGKQIWRLNTRGAARPTPVFRDGKLYLATSGGQLLVVDPATGATLGTFNNPGGGQTGLASPNWFETRDGRLLIIYGTVRPARLLGVDVSNPAQPKLGWSYTPPRAAANAPGDTSPAVDPDLGLMFTNIFINKGTQAAPIFDSEMVALDAATGTLRWSQLMGEGDNPPGFKGGVPMVHNGVVFSGNTINGTFQAFDAATGARIWTKNLAERDDDPGRKHRPRAAPVMFEGKLIFAEQRDIHVLDPMTGTELNRFENPGLLGLWGINQPSIVGRLMILSSITGWIFAFPVDVILNSKGFEPGKMPTLDFTAPEAVFGGFRAGPAQRAVEALDFAAPEAIFGGRAQGPAFAGGGAMNIELPTLPRRPDYFIPTAQPRFNTRTFPDTWLAYAGGPERNSYTPRGPRSAEWTTALNHAYPLDLPPLDAHLYGPEMATQMMHQAFGVGTGVTPANGVLYVGSDRYTIHALNALTGQRIWRSRTQNANFGQPLVTPNTVVVSAGDPWFNLGNTVRFRDRNSATNVGDNFGHVTGLDPRTGVQKWTFFSDGATSMGTPLYHRENLYWVAGDGGVWAINADSGERVDAFYNESRQPRLTLGGFNAISAPNIFEQGGRSLMLAGTAMPNKISAIDLDSAEVAWTQSFSGINTYLTGFAATSLAIDTSRGLAIGSVLIDADATSETATFLAFALDARSGDIVWTQPIGSGKIPVGFTAPTPVISRNTAFFHNPIARTSIALDTASGAVRWQTSVDVPEGRFSWGPGVVIGNRLIQPVGAALYTFDATTGALLNRTNVGGAFTYNHPTVSGGVLYIGNSWGWVSAIPLMKVLGGSR